MKKLILIAGILALTVPAVAGLTGDGAGWEGGGIDQARIAGYADNGGEFTLQPDNNPGATPFKLANSAYAASTRGVDGDPRSFQSFCLERDEPIHDDLDSWVSVADVNGNIPGSHAFAGGQNTNLGDNLDPRTAYLYTQFAEGTLANYNYTPGAGRATDAKSLQSAIWAIELEAGLSPHPAQDLKAKAWVKQAEDAIAGGLWDGLGDVRVLQLIATGVGAKPAGSLEQDQLYLVPAPAAVGLGLFGLSVVGVWLRRNAVAAV